MRQWKMEQWSGDKIQGTTRVCTRVKANKETYGNGKWSREMGKVNGKMSKGQGDKRQGSRWQMHETHDKAKGKTYKEQLAKF